MTDEQKTKAPTGNPADALADIPTTDMQVIDAEKITFSSMESATFPHLAHRFVDIAVDGSDCAFLEPVVDLLDAFLERSDRRDDAIERGDFGGVHAIAAQLNELTELVRDIRTHLSSLLP